MGKRRREEDIDLERPQKQQRILQDSFETVYPPRWSEDHFFDWILSLRNGRFKSIAESLNADGVDGELLYQLTASDFKDSLSARKIDPIQSASLLKSIQKLKKEHPDTKAGEKNFKKQLERLMKKRQSPNVQESDSVQQLVISKNKEDNSLKMNAAEIIDLTEPKKFVKKEAVYSQFGGDANLSSATPAAYHYDTSASEKEKSGPPGLVKFGAAKSSVISTREVAKSIRKPPPPKPPKKKSAIVQDALAKVQRQILEKKVQIVTLPKQSKQQFVKPKPIAAISTRQTAKQNKKKPGCIQQAFPPPQSRLTRAECEFKVRSWVRANSFGRLSRLKKDIMIPFMDWNFGSLHSFLKTMKQISVESDPARPGDFILTFIEEKSPHKDTKPAISEQSLADIWKDKVTAWLRENPGVKLKDFCQRFEIPAEVLLKLRFNGADKYVARYSYITHLINQNCGISRFRNDSAEWVLYLTGMMPDAQPETAAAHEPPKISLSAEIPSNAFLQPAPALATPSSTTSSPFSPASRSSGTLTQSLNMAGYSFILEAGTASTIFVHFKHLKIPEHLHKSLCQGTYLEFDKMWQPEKQKWMATNVTAPNLTIASTASDPPPQTSAVMRCAINEQGYGFASEIGTNKHNIFVHVNEMNIPMHLKNLSEGTHILLQKSWNEEKQSWFATNVCLAEPQSRNTPGANFQESQTRTKGVLHTSIGPKGYGFATEFGSDEHNILVHVRHICALPNDASKMLEKGTRIIFDKTWNEKKQSWFATNVCIAEPQSKNAPEGNFQESQTRTKGVLHTSINPKGYGFATEFGSDEHNILVHVRHICALPNDASKMLAKGTRILFDKEWNEEKQGWFANNVCLASFHSGTMKDKLNNGFGFVQEDGSSESIFVHYSKFLASQQQIDTIDQGTYVEYEKEWDNTKEKWFATNITIPPKRPTVAQALPAAGNINYASQGRKSNVEQYELLKSAIKHTGMLVACDDKVGKLKANLGTGVVSLASRDAFPESCKPGDRFEYQMKGIQASNISRVAVQSGQIESINYHTGIGVIRSDDVDRSTMMTCERVSFKTKDVKEKESLKEGDFITFEESRSYFDDVKAALNIRKRPILSIKDQMGIVQSLEALGGQILGSKDQQCFYFAKAVLLDADSITKGCAVLFDVHQQTQDSEALVYNIRKQTSFMNDDLAFHSVQKITED